MRSLQAKLYVARPESCAEVFAGVSMAVFHEFFVFFLRQELQLHIVNFIKKLWATSRGSGPSDTFCARAYTGTLNFNECAESYLALVMPITPHNLYNRRRMDWWERRGFHRSARLEWPTLATRSATLYSTTSHNEPSQSLDVSNRYYNLKQEIYEYLISWK